MEENINFINKVKISLFNIGRYKDLVKLSFSKALIYSILLSVLVGIITGITSFTAITLLQNTSKKMLEDEKLNFEMEDGILNFENSPMKEEYGKTIVLIDTNKSLSDTDSIRNIVVHKDVSIAFLKDGVSVRNNGEESSFKYKDIIFLPEYLNNESIIKAIDSMSSFKYLIFIVSIFVVYLTFLFNAFIVSLAGVITSKVQGINLKYGDIFKLSLYSMTLPTLIKLIYPLGSLSILVAGTYLILAMNKIQKETTI